MTRARFYPGTALLRIKRLPWRPVNTTPFHYPPPTVFPPFLSPLSLSLLSSRSVHLIPSHIHTPLSLVLAFPFTIFSPSLSLFAPIPTVAFVSLLYRVLFFSLPSISYTVFPVSLLSISYCSTIRPTSRGIVPDNLSHHHPASRTIPSPPDPFQFGFHLGKSVLCLDPYTPFR